MMALFEWAAGENHRPVFSGPNPTYLSRVNYRQDAHEEAFPKGFRTLTSDMDIPGLHTFREALHTWRDNYKFSLLLASIVILLVLYPIFEANYVGEWSLQVLTTLLLISAVYALADSRPKLMAGIFIALCALVTGWLSAFWHMPNLTLVSNSITLFFFVFSTITILSSVLRKRMITLDTIYGGICVYLLMGLTFGMFFFLLDTLIPGSIYPYPVSGLNLMVTFSDHIYYSFYSMTTLGYGAIVPVSAAARTGTLFCAVCGVLYVAVLIAWLVGGLAVQAGKRDS
jgi:voltage-gated potassium channel